MNYIYNYVYKLCLFSRYYDVNDIVEYIDRSRALALPGFHKFTGDDLISSFLNRGKKTCWDIWIMYPAATTFFEALSNPQPDPGVFSEDPLRKICQTYVNKLYGFNDQTYVDEARLTGVVYGGKDFTNIPPSSDALHQKVLRSTFQVLIKLNKFLK